ncbi:uncharacterized protein A4U43_C05F19610 [Asparagus officinalis]|uniref:UBC core domain-containing protein n=1 Tax=Asparagus officinalis TaxID=4686 RepID=A0A5P1ESV1_ASPOF|nr:uncharacterized protein A4U43_C05F19610 [Asparagus officinalis]
MSIHSDDSDYEHYSETSDSEDQDSESTYGGNAQSILSSLDESIGKIDDFLAYERGFVHGDVVCSITDPSGQLGRVVDIDMVVDLETRFGEVIKDVNSKMLQKVRSIASGDYVVHGPWLGRVQRVHDAVTIMFNDGAKCEIMTGDSETVMPISPILIEDAPYPYYLGQRVRIKVPNISKSVRWFCGSPNALRNEGTICDVEVGLVRVNWIASVMMSCSVSPPYHIQKPINLKLLSCFPYANWQLGDWCTLPSDYFSGLHSTSAPHGTTKVQKLGMDDRHCKQMYVITKTKTKVDVLWQNGNCSVGLDSQTLFPANSVGDHDFWPGQFVLEKVSAEDIDASTCQRLGIVKNFDAQDRTVKVKWKVLEAESIEEMVSAYELIEHPDFSYCIGDVVFGTLTHFDELEDIPQTVRITELNQGYDLATTEVSNCSNILWKEKENSTKCHAEYSTAYFSFIGNVIGFVDERVKVKWATGLTSEVYPSEIFGLDRIGDHSLIPTAIDESVPESVTKNTTEQERTHCLGKEKAADNFTEAYEREVWGISSLLFPCASLRFFKSIATNIFGSGVSTSLLGLWKGVPEFLILEPEEADLNGNDMEPQSLEQHEEETKLKENVTPPQENENPRMFKQFDIVDDYSDHHFLNNAGKGLTSQVKRGWLKKVQQEWGILKKDLPDSIYVRVYEERMDLARACIVGAPGTPYHDGLFFFDIFFPPDYPHEPPNFEELVEEHFTRRSHHILQACKVYMDGAPLGSSLEPEKETCISGQANSSTGFKIMLSKLFPKLISEQIMETSGMYVNKCGMCACMQIMETSVVAKNFVNVNARPCLFAGGSSCLDEDLDIIELSGPPSSSSSSWNANNQKRRRTQVVPHEIIDLDKDDDPEVLSIGGSSSDYKNKQPMNFGQDYKKQEKDGLSIEHVGSSTSHPSDNVALTPVDMPKSSTAWALDFNFSDGYDYDDYEYDDDSYEGFEFDTDLAFSDYNSSLAAKFDVLDLPTGIEADVPWLQRPAPEKPIASQPKIVIEDAIDLKFKAFKQFDTVQGHLDHYFANPQHMNWMRIVKEPSKEWAKRIQHEWKLLEKDLPETIYVRVYEDRMDILRAVIIGPSGTPYHDGLFFFDAYFPSDYPNTPPHFEDFVAGHFRKHGRAILVACRAYLDGAQIGCLVEGGVQDVDEGDKSCSPEFRTSLRMLFDDLLMEFTVKGADCDEFLVKKGGDAGAADTNLKQCGHAWMQNATLKL